MIYKLLDEKKRKDNLLTQELDRETRDELNHWVSLVDNFASELKKYQLICTFCGVHLDDSAVNTDCPKNPLITDVSEFQPPTHFYSSTVPTQEYFANGRHFFVKPDEDIIDGNESTLILNEAILKENPYAASAVQKIRAQYDEEKQERLGEILHQVAYAHEQQIAEAEGRDMMVPDATIVNRRDFE